MAKHQFCVINGQLENNHFASLFWISNYRNSSFSRLPDDIWLIDLDSNKLSPPTGIHDDIPALPEPEGTILKNHLKQVETTVIFHRNNMISFWFLNLLKYIKIQYKKSMCSLLMALRLQSLSDFGTESTLNQSAMSTLE